VAFSIPAEKILDKPKQKHKVFAKHLVDPEIAAKVPGSSLSYAFADEHDYYADLQASKFCVTTKRAGWDCLRHYEIAANGCVPCFKNLNAKPGTCAPHGLVIGVNCLSYYDSSDLFRQIDSLSPEAYENLVGRAMQWARLQSTVTRAQMIIYDWEGYVRNL